MECYFNESSSFSPIPQPRRTQSKTAFTIISNFNYDDEPNSFILTKEECETPRTIPRKPRKPNLTPTHKTLNQKQIQRSCLASASYHEASIQRLARPNAPPPPLPLNSQPSLIESLPDYYNTTSHNGYSKNPSTDYSEVFNSTFSSNLSTPKVSRTDLLFNTSYDNLISEKKKIKISEIGPKKDEFHIGFKNFEHSGFYHNIKLPLVRQKSQKRNEKRPNLLTKLNKGLYSPGRFFTTKILFNCTVIILGFILFFFSMLFIILFQKKVHNFNSNLTRILQNSSNFTQISSENFKAGSELVRKTVQFCNGPYFSYQINNLVVLPFSLLLLLIFSFFTKRKNSCILDKKNPLSCGGKNRLSLPGVIDPFQRRNRLLVAALFCIIANEIFKMIETSMFNVTVYDGKNYLFNKTFNGDSNTDFLRIGLGIEPIYSRTTPPQTLISGSYSTTKSYFMISPPIIQFSKPPLPRRLRLDDLTTSTIRNHLHESYDYDEAVRVANGLQKLRSTKNKTKNILASLNKTLEGSEKKTLFEVSMSLYQNEYIQKAVNTMFDTKGFAWNILFEKLEKLAIMLLEVLIIGMRYYPLLGVMERDSLVCLFLATIYMWADTSYNVVITGMCEGLKLNVSFDLLKDLRRLFGVGFLIDAKKNLNGLQTDEPEVDTKFLFSTNRIIYTIVKSLPHFYCLSYVTIRLTATFVKKFYKRFYSKNKSIRSKKTCQGQYVDLIYTKKCVYGQIKKGERPKQVSASFEEKYVRNLFLKSSFYFIKKTNWYDRVKAKLSFNDNFRFSTRVVCSYTVCFTVLYYLTCFMVFYGSIFIDLIYMPVVYKYAIIFSTCAASVICIVQLTLSMQKFKVHLKSLYKGKSDRYISPKSYFSNHKIAVSSFNYAGYVVTYTTWGFIFLFAVISFLTFQVATLFVFGSTNIVGTFLFVILVPFIVSLILIRLLNRLVSSLLAKFCFLQNKSKVLALKNLRTYSLFLYFKFFYDCFTGLAFCLVRMFNSILIGVLFMPRVDYSFMGRGLERMDPAFMSYIGYLHWESHHTNPIAIVFCELMRKSRKQKRKELTSSSSCLSYSEQIKRNQIINRWKMCYILIKNPDLIKLRRQ